ncbi:MAG: glutamine ABC transporter ATP-binding protein GlnQ, partial [Spirochaetaceae bacterium]|jgi:ABC-type polar amino acid transport system ATPase subunit|nr:glutamine ABC transporter ATP-binding protein GlnQ [Spirochaetaceae bacterium]
VIKELVLGGMTTLIVTHEMNFAREISSRVVFMEDGLVMEAGSPEVVFQNPREERTRRFLNLVAQA